MNWTLTYFPCSNAQDFTAWTPLSRPIEPGRPAVVPGVAQTSPFGVPYADLLFHKNWEKVAWMEEKLWVYRAEFETSSAAAGRVWLLTFKGLDYRTRIFLNGTLVDDHEGMFSPVEIELPAVAAKHVVHLAFLPPVLLGEPFAPKEPGAPEGPILHLKARYMKGWDFCPRLACVGPWDDVILEQRPLVRIEHLAVTTRLDNAARADVAVTIHFNRPPGRGTVRAELGGASIAIPTGERLRYTIALQVANPVLWWPHTHGKPHLYPLRVSHLDANGIPSDTAERRVGLRSVKRRPAVNQLPTATPLQLEINGVPVFLIGMNLTPFSSVPADLTAADYDRVLRPLRDTGVNFLRVWGGGLREKTAFYDWCDRHGLLVMQEFPLACQRISHDARWLDLLEREGRVIARTLAARASVIWWTGGNEHYHFWECLDSGTPLMEGIKADVIRMFALNPDDRLLRGGDASDHPALRLLEGVAREETPGNLYDITSALEDQGDVHGPWNLRLPISDHRFRDKEFFNHWRTTRAHSFSECAVGTVAHPDTIAQILGLPGASALADLPIPRRDDPVWVAHKAFHAAWDQHEDLWFDIPETERYFGPISTLPALLFANHYLQCEAARYMVESIRRHQGHTTGLVWWGANEPFAGLAGCALVDFFGRVKPALRVLGSAFAPHLLSLDYERCVLRKFRGDLVFTNSLPERFQGRYEVRVFWFETAVVVDTYAGTIDAPGYSVVRLAELVPVTLRNETPLAIQLTLVGDDRETPLAKQYLFFANSRSDALQPLLKHAARPVEGFFI